MSGTPAGTNLREIFKNDDRIGCLGRTDEGLAHDVESLLHSVPFTISFVTDQPSSESVVASLLHRQAAPPLKVSKLDLPSSTE